MALPNPSQPDVPLQQEDVLIAEWVEPTLPTLFSKLKQPRLLAVGVGLVFVILITLAIVLHNSDFLLGATLVASASSAFYAQYKHTPQALTIRLTTTLLYVGKHTYPLNDLAGFWLERNGDFLAVNVEPNKAVAIPITFLYPNTSSEECRELLLEALPEVEPRIQTVNDRLNRWIHL